MGILNVTPDSFSDGGRFDTFELACQQAARLVSDGADIIDVGGESTRPGSEPVPAYEECRRTVPVIEWITRNFKIPVSIDTQKAEVAEAALEAGATIINDVSGGRDIGMVNLVKNPGISIILMHMPGTPATMQSMAQYPSGVVSEVSHYLKERVRLFGEAGIPAARIWVDPGIGFGKTADHCLDLLRHLEEFKGIGSRLVVGTSRKSFLLKAAASLSASPEERTEATLATNLWAWKKGADVLRVHDVAPLRRALRTWQAVERGLGTEE